MTFIARPLQIRVKKLMTIHNGSGLGTAIVNHSLGDNFGDGQFLEK